MTDISTLYTHLNTLTKQWFYDKSETDTLLGAKADSADLANVATSGSYDDLSDVPESFTPASHEHAASEVKDSNAHSHLSTTANATQATINTAIDTAVGAKANSADLATVATSGSYADLSNIPSTFAPTAHEHSAGDVKDSSAYTNLGTSANATQAAINYAIDTKIGALLSIDLIEVEDTLPTASASTMNKLYLVPESTPETHDSYEVYVTVAEDDDGTTVYSWEKIDTARIDLSGKADANHTHGNLTNDGKIGSNANYFVTTTTGGAVTSAEKIGNITTSGAIGSDSGKLAVTTTNGVLTTSDMITELDTTVQALIQYGNSS